jgi:site-specific recombinase XerD
MGDYLLPIITKNYDGVELYDHVRTRYKRINMNMKKLGKELGIRLPLTTYVSRHSMAMTLQENNMPREVISQALGHKNLTTTNVYLDSFKTEVLDNAARVL